MLSGFHLRDLGAGARRLRATMAGYHAWLVAELEATDGPIDLVGHDWGTGMWRDRRRSPGSDPLVRDGLRWLVH